MEAAIPKMEKQLRSWRRTIDRLAAAVHGVGTGEQFDALLYIDELKALHAVARFRLEAFKVAGSVERALLAAGLKGAWDEMDAAVASLDP
jgi:hypothetical protein